MSSAENLLSKDGTVSYRFKKKRGENKGALIHSSLDFTSRLRRRHQGYHGMEMRETD